MRVLLIKTSSMGDIIHTLPALTDAAKAIPGIQFDWMVEESFAEIPAWHPAVAKVIPIHLRRWRKNILAKQTRLEIAALRQELKKESYDLILDAQGLAKSALLMLLTKGRRAGLDFRSARESLASLVYQRRYTVNFYQHAITRMRSLFSQALGYTLEETNLDYGLQQERFQQVAMEDPYFVFLHATTWESKQWPEAYWIELANIAASAGYRVKTSGGNKRELARAQRLASACPNVDALPKQTISQMATLVANAKASVAVDTGFGHLAAALNVPLISIYGATNPEYTRAIGNKTETLAAQFPCSPCLKRECTYKAPSVVTPACYGTITPQRVWEKMHSFRI